MTDFTPIIITDGAVTSGTAPMATVELGNAVEPMPEFIVSGPALVQPGTAVVFKDDGRICYEGLDLR